MSALLLDDRGTDASCNSTKANWIVADLVLNRVLNRSKDSMASLACSNLSHQSPSDLRPVYDSHVTVFDP